MSKESKEMLKAQKQLEKEKAAWDKKEAKLAKKDKNYVAQPFPGDVAAGEAAPVSQEPVHQAQAQKDDVRYPAPLQLNTTKGYFNGMTPDGKIKDGKTEMAVYYASLPICNPVPVLTPSPVVQLNPTIFPVSFVPYVTQNQPILQTVAMDDENADYGYEEGYDQYADYGDAQQ